MPEYFASRCSVAMQAVERGRPRMLIAVFDELFVLVRCSPAAITQQLEAAAQESAGPVPRAIAGRSRSQIRRLHVLPHGYGRADHAPFEGSASSAARIATAANFTISVAPGTSPTSPNIIAAKEKAHVQPRDAFFKNRTAMPERAYTEWLKESPGIHQVRQSGRSACRAGNLRHSGLPSHRNARSFHQHDDAHGISVGRGAL